MAELPESTYEPRTAADQAAYATILPAPPDLGAGEPPAEMVETFGMEAVPDDGAGDEAEGEVLDADEAEAESERLANP